MPIFGKTVALFGTVMALPSLLLAAPVLAQGKSDTRGTASYSGTLAPLNGSGVTGTFTIERKGQGQIRVHIQATGLEVTPQVHLGHIHGLEGNADATCPTQADDTDEDGFVELAEGLPKYGPIIVDFGDVDPNNDGIANYSMTFNLNQSSTFNGDKTKNDLLPLDLRVIVLHGMTVGTQGAGTPGEVDGTPGYKVVLPVACGEIMKDNRRNPMEFRTP